MTRCTSACFVSLLTLLLWLSSVEASHFRFGNIAWSPTQDSSNNTMRFTFRLAFRKSYSYSYYCDENTISQRALIGYGDSWTSSCSDVSNPLCYSTYLADTGFHCTDFSDNEDWSMGENNFTYTFPSSNSVWTVSYTSCCWISLSIYGDGQWLVSTKIDLTPRSDNGKINSSPVTRSPAIVRFQESCNKTIRIPVEDPDGDFVKCRWASVAESAIPSDSFPYGALDEKKCELKYGGESGTAGTYAVTLTLEDFPAGTTNFNNVRPFSAVGLQFLVIITGQSGPCDDIPVFTDSTPQDGECSEIQIGSAYTAVIEVQLADLAKHVVEITTSSPSGMQITSLRYHRGIYYRNVTWYPSQYQVGQQLFCFQALDSSGLQSQWRCVTILVGLSNTPQVIEGSQWPMYPISERGPGLIWLRIQFDRVIKKPRSSASIRLVLQPSSYTVYKVDTLSQYVIIDSNRTVLHFAMPKAALSMNGSYAILIDHGAVVGQGCSYDGPPTPGIKSASDWGFIVDGVCPVGYSLAPPGFTNCVDVNECGSNSRSKRNLWWWWWSTPISSSTAVYGGPVASASASSSYLSECFNHSYLEDSVRGMGFYNGYYGYYQCDRYLPSGWYRFRGEAGTQMPTSCVGKNRCSSHAPGWLVGSHPSVADGVVYATVCFHWNLGCCHWSTSIRVRNCSGFYVYELGPTPACYLRYCGNGGANYSMASITSTTVISPTPVYYSSASATTFVSTPTPVNGIHPTPASAMPSSFYAASSVNILPNPSQFELHLPSDCDQICSNTYGSYTCSCVNGYQLAPNGKSCLDIDECSNNNGGCSHHCFNIPGSFYCGCPEGRSMGVNNLTCVEPGVSVSCGDSNMTVSLEKRTFPFFEVSQLHLRYSSCRATQNDTHLLINTPLNGCGTLVNETQDALIFWNEIQADAVIIDYVITRTHDIKLPFYCSYSRRKLLSLSFTPQPIHFGIEAGYGNFTFRIDFYKSSLFNTPYTQQDYPLQFELNDYVYIRYSVESSADLVIMAENCKATKDGSYYSWPQYTIIQNGCPRDTTMDYSFDTSRSFQQFKIKTFRFFNDYDTVYFHCELLACHRYSPNSRCSQGCLISNKRKKRDVTRDEIEHEESTNKVILTQGPLVFKKEEQQSGNTEQSKQAGALIGGVAAAGGFGLIAVAALAVLFVKYRIARRFMNRNKVGDLYTTQDQQLSRKTAYIQEDDMIEKDDAL